MESGNAFTPARPIRLVQSSTSVRPMVDEKQSSLLEKDETVANSVSEEGQGPGTIRKKVFGAFRNLLRWDGVKEDEPVESAPMEPVKPEPLPEMKLEMIEEKNDVEEEDENGVKKMLQQIKESGKAGFISYALWEWAFWLVSLPVACFGYYKIAGHWPDFNNKDDMAGVGAEAFAFVNFARFAVPLRVGLALSTTGWVKENIVDRWFPEDGQEAEETKDE